MSLNGTGAALAQGLVIFLGDLSQRGIECEC